MIFIERIFAKPLLVSLIVGSCIHLFLGLNDYIFIDLVYIETLTSLWANNPFYLLIKILIPYLIPFFVTTMTKSIAKRSNEKIIANFPDMNPNMVIKINEQLDIDFQNSATKDLLQRLGLRPHELNRLLPPNYLELACSIIGTHLSHSIDYKIDNRIIEFTFRSSPEQQSVFLSGLDVTKIRNKSKIIDQCNLQLKSLVNFYEFNVNRAINDNLNRETTYLAMLKAILVTDDETQLNPKAIFIAYRKNNDLQGYIYTEDNQQIHKDSHLMSIDNQSTLAKIICNEHKATWSDWDAKTGTLADYQLQFHPEFRNKVQQIKSYSSYLSGNTAIIALYDKPSLTEYHAHVIQMLAVFINGLEFILKTE